MVMLQRLNHRRMYKKFPMSYHEVVICLFPAWVVLDRLEFPPSTHEYTDTQKEKRKHEHKHRHKKNK